MISRTTPSPDYRASSTVGKLTKQGPLRAKQRNRRKDWIEKTSTRLVRANDVIVLECRERGIRMLAPAAGYVAAARGADRVAGALKREPTLADPAA